jgi:copper transport protein
MMIKRLMLPPLLAILALLALCMPVSAHAILVRSEPPDGASLGAAPQQLRMWFSEPIALGFTTLELVDGDGRHIPVQAHADAASLAVAVRAGESAGAVLVVIDLPKLAPNVYSLHWRTLSNNDLHSTEGSLIFGVGRTADHATTAVAALAPSPLEVALRWLNFGAIAGLLGALAVAWLAIRRGDGRRETGDGSVAVAAMTGKLRRLALWSAVLALLAGCVLLVSQALAAGGTAGQSLAASLGQIVGGTSYGLAWALRQGVLLALLAALVLRLKRRSPFPPPALSLVLILALAIAQALQSHATAFDTISPLRVLADALHVLAASLWSGGVLALAVAIVPLLRHDAEEATLAWAILRRFGALAAAALAALLITGLFMTGQQVASPDALLTTFYGRALMLKVALALGVGLLGLRNAATLHPRVATLLRRTSTPMREESDPHTLPSQRDPSPLLLSQRERGAGGEGRLARTVRFEAAGALALLLLAAALSAAQPARGPEFDPPAEVAGAPAATTRAGDLIVTLSVKPNLPGRNFISLGVFNTRRPAPAPIQSVLLGLQAPGAATAGALLPIESLGDGRYQVADDSLARAGDWQLVVVVKRPGLPDTAATLPWTVLAPAPARQPVLISNQPLAPALTLAALLVALLLLGALAATRLRQPLARYARARHGAAPPRERPMSPEERAAP